MTDPKQTVFTISDSRPLGLLDEVAAELGGDREEALGHILDLTRTARAMGPIIPAPADRDVIDEWEPA
jgi:hypothetical protein